MLMHLLKISRIIFCLYVVNKKRGSTYPPPPLKEKKKFLFIIIFCQLTKLYLLQKLQKKNKIKKLSQRDKDGNR